MNNLTARQLEYVKFMAVFFVENDQLPPSNVLAKKFNVRPNSINDLRASLSRKRVIEKNSIGKWKRGPMFNQVIVEVES